MYKNYKNVLKILQNAPSQLFDSALNTFLSR